MLVIVVAERMRGDYEFDLSFRPPQGGIVIDCGAYIGVWTVYWARTVGKEGLVIAIEPEVSNYKTLLQNISLNKLTNVFALQLALFDRDFSLITLYKQHHTPSLTSVFPVIAGTNDIDVLESKTLTLDFLVASLGLKKVDLVKVDAEGAELRIFKGAQRALRNRKLKRIVVEVHQTYINLLDIVRALKDYCDITIYDSKFGTLLLYASLSNQPCNQNMIARYDVTSVGNDERLQKHKHILT